MLYPTPPLRRIGSSHEYRAEPFVQPVAVEQFDRTCVAGGSQLRIHRNAAYDRYTVTPGNLIDLAFSEYTYTVTAIRANGMASPPGAAETAAGNMNPAHTTEIKILTIYLFICLHFNRFYSLTMLRMYSFPP